MAMTPSERARSRCSLVSLIQSLDGERTTIELRDETIVEGKIDHVDCYMNVQLTDATLFPKFVDSKAQQFERFFVSGKLIRYVHIPDHIDMLASIQKQTTQLTSAPKKRYQAMTNAQKRKERMKELEVKDKK